MTFGEPVFRDAAPDLYVRFEATSFARPTICWLNRRFWQDEGLDLADRANVDKLKSDLLEQFGVSVPNEEFHPASSFTSRTTTLYADRYGAPQGGLHGGSGRCGTAGRFNAKGIGRTPLCNMAKDWYHTHGCLWMEEAIRETIFSNIASAVFPKGAVPVVAVIDTGERLSGLHGAEAGARRAIIVRPSLMRLAHLERSIFFGTSGTRDSSQYRDALRVKQCLSIAFPREREGGLARQLIAIFSAIGTQIGFGQAHRLFHGDYHSTNLAIGGALIDFGAFRSVPSWRKQKWEDRGVYFGSEASNVARSVGVLLFQCGKNFPGENLPTAHDVTQALSMAAEQARESEFTKVASCDESVGSHTISGIVDVLKREYQYQQELDGIGPITGMDTEKSPQITHSTQVNRDTSISDIKSLLFGSAATRDRSSLAFNRILKWYSPLSNASREAVQRRADAFLTGAFANPDRANSDRLISEYIDSSISAIAAELKARSVG